MQINTIISCIYNYWYKNDHKHILLWFKMIISMFTRILLIFHDLITFYEHFMTLTYHEDNFSLIIK